MQPRYHANQKKRYSTGLPTSFHRNDHMMWKSMSSEPPGSTAGWLPWQWQCQATSGLPGGSTSRLVWRLAPCDSKFSEGEGHSALDRSAVLQLQCQSDNDIMDSYGITIHRYWRIRWQTLQSLKALQKERERERDPPEISQNTMQHNSCADNARSSKCQIFSKGRAELWHEAVYCYHNGHTPSWLQGQHQPRWVRSKKYSRRNHGNRLQQTYLKPDLLREACPILSDFQDVLKHFWWLGCSPRPIEYWIASQVTLAWCRPTRRVIERRQGLLPDRSTCRSPHKLGSFRCLELRISLCGALCWCILAYLLCKTFKYNFMRGSNHHFPY